MRLELMDPGRVLLDRFTGLIRLRWNAETREELETLPDDVALMGELHELLAAHEGEYMNEHRCKAIMQTLEAFALKWTGHPLVGGAYIYPYRERNLRRDMVLPGPKQRKVLEMP